jgi:hypothetical protein
VLTVLGLWRQPLSVAAGMVWRRCSDGPMEAGLAWEAMGTVRTSGGEGNLEESSGKWELTGVTKGGKRMAVKLLLLCKKWRREAGDQLHSRGGPRWDSRRWRMRRWQGVAELQPLQCMVIRHWCGVAGTGEAAGGPTRFKQ